MKLLPKLGLIKLYKLMGFTLKFYKQPLNKYKFFNCHDWIEMSFLTAKCQKAPYELARLTLKVPFLIPFNL